MPQEALTAFGALFAALPLWESMPELLPSSRNEKAAALIPAAPPLLQAALWLYVDDLNQSHTISQNIAGPLGAYWHGIMHRREGDFWNAKYWFRQARGVELGLPGYEPSNFVDRVEAGQGANVPELVQMQRDEWQALFNLCIAEVRGQR